jgi:alpha-tubulin suppressor-like RCC1 family protein
LPAASAADANGVAKATLSSTRAEAKSVSAVAGGVRLAQTSDVQFIPGAPDPAGTSLSSAPSSGFDDGSPLTVKVVVGDKNGNRVVGASVSISSTGIVDISPAVSHTDATGEATFFAGTMETGSHSFTALVGGNVLATKAILFSHAPVNLQASTLTLGASLGVADGSTPVDAIVDLVDTIGRPVVGEAVRLSFTGVGLISPSTTASDGLGRATFGITAASSTSGVVRALVGPSPTAVVLAAAPALEFRGAFFVGGTVSGLTADGLVLSMGSQPHIPVNSGASVFGFSEAIAIGAQFEVRVVSHPAGLFCGVSGGIGTMGTTDVNTILVWCEPSTLWATVASGGEHTVAVRADGSLWTWGCNSSGQLGDGTVADKFSPTRIGSDTDWSSVAAGESFTVATRSDGTLWAWGNNALGQYGDGTQAGSTSPVRVGSINDWTGVFAGGFTTLAHRTDGSLWWWGRNAGTSPTTLLLSPVLLGSGFSSVSVGDTHVVAVKGEQIWVWGANTYDALGLGPLFPRSATPLLLSGGGPLAGKSWKGAGAGKYHSFALAKTGELFGWGKNEHSEIGGHYPVCYPPPTVDVPYPVGGPVGSDTDWVAATGGVSNSLALKSDGSLWTWGGGGAYQCSFPTKVGDGYSKVVAGAYYVIAIKSDGTMWAWGDNSCGQLGIGTTGGGQVH